MFKWKKIVEGIIGTVIFAILKLTKSFVAVITMSVVVILVISKYATNSLNPIEALTEDNLLPKIIIGFSCFILAINVLAFLFRQTLEDERCAKVKCHLPILKYSDALGIPVRCNSCLRWYHSLCVKEDGGSAIGGCRQAHCPSGSDQFDFPQEITSFPIKRTPNPTAAYKGDRPFIFISYAHADIEEVHRDIERLQGYGYRIYYDGTEELGGIFATETLRAIQDCSFFILFLSLSALQSGKVHRETSLALHEQKRILPIYLREEATRPSDLHLFFAPESLLEIKKYNLPREDYLKQLTEVLPLSVKQISLYPEGSSEYGFEREITSSIKRTHGWIPFMADELLKTAERLGLSQEAAQRILITTLAQKWADEEYRAKLEMLQQVTAHFHSMGGALLVESAELKGSLREALDPVNCTVFAPPLIPQGEIFMVQVFAHLLEQTEKTGKLALGYDKSAKNLVSKSLEVNIERGTKLTFDLVTDPKLEVDNPVQSLIWDGRPEAAQFGIKVPTRHKPGNVIGTVTVSQNSIPIGHLKFKLTITAASATRSPQPMRPVGNHACRYTKAFISYATEDRNEVLQRIQMLKAFEIDYFQDVLDLDPGDRWEKELYRNIDQCDLFLLFWSSAAKKSKWVRKEAQHALKQKDGNEFAPPEIKPIILEGPPVPLPWKELAHLHFNDRLIYFMNRQTP